MLLYGEVQAGGVSGYGYAEHVGGYAGKRCGREGYGSVERGDGCSYLGGKQFGLGAAAVAGARRGPCVKRLVDAHEAAGHGVGIHIEDTERDLARGS